MTTLTNSADLPRVLAELSDEEWGLLAGVYLSGDSGLTLEVAHQVVGLFSGRRRRSVGHVPERLKELGLLESELRQYRHVLFVPHPLQAILREHVCARLKPQGVLETEPPGQEQAPTLVEDTARLLALVRRGELLLTQQGQLQRRALRSVTTHLGLAELDADTADRYPEPLGLILAYTLDRGLAAREPGAIVAGPRLDEWLDTPPDEQSADLLLFWQQRHQAGDVEAAVRLLGLNPAVWWPLDLLAEMLSPLVNPVNRSSLRLRLEHHLRAFLAPLGHVALRSQGTIVYVSAGRPASPAKVTLYVQPDYEIVAARPLPARLLFALELLADLVHLDQRVQNYRLCSTSFYRALGLGMEAQAAIETLVVNAPRGLPQNVAFDLNDWAQHYGQISFSELLVLRCGTPEMAERIAMARKVQPYITERLGPSALVVRRNQYEQVLEALRHEGYLPKPGIEREE